MAINSIQSTNTGGAGLTASNSVQTSAFSSSVTSGNSILVVIFGYINTTATTVSVTDTGSNSYTCDLLNAYNSGSSNVISNPGSNNVPAGVSWVGIWRASNVIGGSSFKVTITLGGSVQGLFAATAWEVSGLAANSPVDVTANNAGASGSPSSSTFTTGYPTDLLLTATAGTGGSSTPNFTAPSGFTAFGAETATSLAVDGDFAYDLVSAVQSSINATWTVTNFTDWVTATVAYKADLIVQLTSQAGTTSGNSLQTSAFGSSVTSGNAVIVTLIGAMGSTAATISISDTESNTYTCDLFDCYNSGDDVIANPGTTNVPANKDFVGIWRAANVTGGSSFKATATIGGSNTAAMYLAASEFMNLGSSVTIDTSAHGAAGSGANPTTGSFSTTNAHDLIITGCAGSGATGSTLSTPWTSGWTSLCSHVSGGLGLQGDVDYRVVTSTQSGLDPTWTSSKITSSVAIAVAYEANSSPSTPSGLAVTNDATNPTTALDISWNSVSGATSYTLLRANTLAGTFTTLTSGITGTTYTDSSLVQGTEYAYEVEAVNGSGASAASSAVAWATAPAALSGLTVNPNVNPNELSLGWSTYSPNSNLRLSASGFPYAIRYEVPPGAGNWQSSASSVASETLIGLTAAAQYGVEVAVIIQSSNGDWNGGVQSPWSSEVDATTYPVPRDTLIRQSVTRACTW